jgi:hypothetical protein
MRRTVIGAALLGSVATVAAMGLWSAATLPATHQADVTWTETVEGASPTIGDPWAWSACVTTVYNMGGGTDADMATCDRLYPVSADIVADCQWNTDEGAQDWGTEVARCTWKVRD